MKRIYVGIIAALYAVASFATTLSPITLLNPAGSTSGKVIASTGPTTAPAWTAISALGYATLASPAFTGIPTAPTAATAVATTQLATTQFVSNFLSAPPEVIGGTTPSSGIFNTLTATALNNTPIGLASPQSAVFTTLTASSTVSGAGFTSLLSPYATTASVTAAVAAVTPTVMTTYTPTVTAGSGTFTTTSATGRFYTIGKLVFFEATVTITTVGTAGGAVIVGLPATTNASGGVTSFAGHETAINGKMLTAISSASTSVMAVTNYDATAAIGAGFVLVVSGSYVSN